MGKRGLINQFDICGLDWKRSGVRFLSTTLILT